jgi:hypothetical protein
MDCLLPTLLSRASNTWRLSIAGKNKAQLPSHWNRRVGYARSLNLNLLDQLKGFEKNGQFRYTPPTHAILAFGQALNELEQEGGVAGRGARYRQNHEALVEGMKRLGFRPYLDPAVQSYIISSFYYPDTERFDFDAFYRRLSDKGFIIYPGKISQAKTFRIGSIGRIFPSDIAALLSAIGSALKEMGIKIPSSRPCRAKSGGRHGEGKTARHLRKRLDRAGWSRFFLREGESGDKRHAWYCRCRKSDRPPHSPHLQRRGQPLRASSRSGAA